MSSDIAQGQKRKRDDSLVQLDVSRSKFADLGVNHQDAQAIMSALLQAYPEGRDEVRHLFQMIDEGSAVEIDAIPDVLVRDSLRLLFQCLRLDFHTTDGYTLGSRTPKLLSIFDDVSCRRPPPVPAGPAEQIPNAPKRVIGPTMPPTMADQDDDDDEFGPPVSFDNKPIAVERSAHVSSHSGPDQADGRESWMTHLPEGRTGVSTAHGLVARSFSRKGVHEVGDRSSWTDTAADKQRKLDERLAVTRSGKRHEKKSLEKCKESVPVAAHEVDRRPTLLQQYQANPQTRAKASVSPTAVWDRERDLVRGTQVSVSNLKSIVSNAKSMGSRFSKGASLQ